MRSAYRYAIYYAPAAASDLALFAAAWLGWDPASGTTVAHPDAPPLAPADVARVTRSPRRYGFHGTLKAPFRLTAGAAYDDLQSAVAALASTLPPVLLPGLRLSRLGRFIALTAIGDEAPLATLAERLTVDLDALRAPLDAAELARRRDAGLSARQDEYLMRWGYPYVLDEFRFHLSLTGALPPEDLERAEAALRPLVKRFEPVEMIIGEVCIFADPGTGSNFRIVDRIPLTG